MTHRHRVDIAALLIVLTLAAACGYTLPPAPTAPTTASPVSLAPVRFLLEPSRQPDRSAGFVMLHAWAENGAFADLDATCASDHGEFVHARAHSTAPVLLTLKGSTVLTRVTCTTTNGLTAAAHVDLSAWEMHVSVADEVGFGRVTRLVLDVLTFSPSPPRLTSSQVDWGDGTVEPWLGDGRHGSVMTFLHEYAGPGHFTIRPRITWGGGVAERTILISRTCNAQGFCTTTWRTP